MSYKQFRKNKYNSDSEEEDEIKREMSKELKTQINYIYLSGPSKLCKLINPITNQIIYLFGEFHGYDQDCEIKEENRTFTMLEYFSYIFTNTNNLIDFYLEAPLVYLLPEDRIIAYNKMKSVIEKMRGFNKVETLVILRDAFKECFDPNIRHNCIYKKVRFHYTDLRPFYSMENMGREIFFIKTKNEWNTFKEKYSEEIKELSLIKNCEDYFDYIYEKIKLNKNLIKQIQKSEISLQVLKNILLKLCNKFYYHKYVIFYYNLLKSEELPRDYLKQNPIKEYIDIEQDLSDLIQNQLAVIHDIYTFLRMIKKMDDKFQKNIIFYGGLAHYENLKEIFLSLNFIEQFEEVSFSKIRKRCLRIQKHQSINFESNHFESNINKNIIKSNIREQMEKRQKEIDYSEIDKEFDELSDED